MGKTKFSFIFIIFILFSTGFYCYSQENFLLKNFHMDIFFGGEATGGKISIPLAEIRFYESKDKTSQNIGFAWHSDTILKSFPFSIKAGNLTPGGLYSKMKNPLISTSLSAFSSGQTEANYITANLPSSNSFSRPLSYYIQAGYVNPKEFLREVKISYFNSDLENSQSLSAKIKISPTTGYALSLSSCSGYFDYSEKTSSSWFIQSPFYHDGSHFCTATQFSAVIPLFENLFTIVSYETPFGKMNNIFRMDIKFKEGPYSFFLAGTYVPEQVLTSDDVILNRQAQIKSSFQYHFFAGLKQPFLIKSGISTYLKINPGQATHTLKNSAGVQFLFPVTTISICGNLNSTVKNPNDGPMQISFDSGGFILKNLWYIQNCTPSLTYAKNINPSTDFTSITKTDSIEFNYNFSGSTAISDKYKYEITRKTDEDKKQTLSNTVSIIQKFKHFSVTCKFSMSLEF